MILPPTAAHLAEAAAALRAGELVALPTETVYGLGADACQPAAVAAVFARKGRPADHPLIVHVGKPADVKDWTAAWPEAAARLATHFWPGPLTLVCERGAAVLMAVTGGQDTVALRCPAHPVAQALLQSFGGALVAPSANRYGRISPTSAEHVQADFGDALRILDGGPCVVGIESTIVDVTGAPRILRPGAIGAQALEAVLGQPLSTDTHRPRPRVPGALAAHYAPRRPLQWVTEARLIDTVAQLAVSQQVAVWSPVKPNVGECLWLPAPSEPNDYARLLYARLHELDASGADQLIVSLPDTTINNANDTNAAALWAAIADRLGRAAAPQR